MLSPQLAADPNPSCPALCRQDTTPPWSSDYGRNIYSKTVIEIFDRKKRDNLCQKKEKEKCKT